MKQLHEMLQQGQLTPAIVRLENILKDDPINVDCRSSLIELLCIKGDLERADKQLNLMVQKHPEFIVGATNLRQLIRAAQIRQDFSNGQNVPELFNEVNKHSEALLKLNIEIHNGDDNAISLSADNLEKVRPKIASKLNGNDISELRDLDDTLGGFVEIFGTDGKYYLADICEIEYIHIKPVNSLIEQVWRRVDLSIKNGPSGEAHLPITYVNSGTDAEKLGRETAWKDIADGTVIGLGQKMWLADENASLLSDWSHLDNVSALS